MLGACRCPHDFFSAYAQQFQLSRCAPFPIIVVPMLLLPIPLPLHHCRRKQPMHPTSIQHPYEAPHKYLKPPQKYLQVGGTVREKLPKNAKKILAKDVKILLAAKSAFAKKQTKKQRNSQNFSNFVWGAPTELLHTSYWFWATAVPAGCIHMAPSTCTAMQ